MSAKEGFMDTTLRKLMADRLVGPPCLAVLISACRPGPQAVVDITTAPTEKVITITSVSQSINYYTHVSEMIEEADVILIGTAVDTGLRYNGSRTQDLIHPDESRYSEISFLRFFEPGFVHQPEQLPKEYARKSLSKLKYGFS
jgi:hypothetical protein